MLGNILNSHIVVKEQSGLFDRLDLEELRIMWKYLRFGIFNWIATLGTAASFIVGGPWMWFGLVYMFTVGVGGELISPDDNSEPKYRHPWICDWIAYSVGVSLVIALVAFVWIFNGNDLLSIGAWTSAQFGYDALAVRDTNTWIHYLGAALSLGVILGVQGIVVGHELTHRTEDALPMFIGRWVFALMFGNNFATEHVHGHHKNLGFANEDAVSVRRGTGFYTFLTKGTFTQWKHGWKIESQRLGSSPWSVRNQLIRAFLRGTLVAALVFWFAGSLGFLYYLFAIGYAKFILEGLNYFSHYGLVRESGTPIGVRHTFSSNNAIGNAILLNLGRHGAHHADGGHYENYGAYPDMPQSPYGYLVMTVISWIPPLFKKVMMPVVKDWDQRYATPAERKLAEAQNASSGINSLREAPRELTGTTA